MTSGATIPVLRKPATGVVVLRWPCGNLREVEPNQSRADEAFVAAETTLASLMSNQVQLEAILGPEETRAERERKLSATLTDLDQSLSEAKAHVLRPGENISDLASIEAALTSARSIEAAADRDINTLRETMAGLNAEIRAQSEEARDRGGTHCGDRKAGGFGERGSHPSACDVGIGDSEIRGPRALPQACHG